MQQMQENPVHNQAQEFSCFSRRHNMRARFHSCNPSRYFDNFISEFIATAIMIHFLIPFFSSEFRKCRCISLSEFHSILFKDVLNSIHISKYPSWCLKGRDLCKSIVSFQLSSAPINEPETIRFLSYVCLHIYTESISNKHSCLLSIWCA